MSILDRFLLIPRTEQSHATFSSTRRTRARTSSSHHPTSLTVTSQLTSDSMSPHLRPYPPDLTYVQKERFWPMMTSRAHTKGFGRIESNVATSQLRDQKIMKPFASLGRLMYGRTVWDSVGTDLARPTTDQASSRKRRVPVS